MELDQRERRLILLGLSEALRGELFSQEERKEVRDLLQKLKGVDDESHQTIDGTGRPPSE